MGRDEQVQKMLAEEERLRAIDSMDDDELSEAYVAAWDEIKAGYAKAEPLHVALIARAVRAHEPGATSIKIDATDQGGPGWVYAGDNEAISDDDDISVLLSDLGEFMSSEDHPAQEFEFIRENT